MRKNNDQLQLIEEKNGVKIYFDTENKVYCAFMDGEFITGNAYRLSDVKQYLN